jgi:hypothetical protein
MTETQLLIGSLSNDLLRVANMIQRGSIQGSARFFSEALKWNAQLKQQKLKPYIQKIIADLETERENSIFTMEKAEKFLMYSVLLQNYTIYKH